MDDFNNKIETLQQLTDSNQNQFADPFKEMWKKLFATGAYIVLIFGGFIMLSFIKYEFQGQAAHYRTVMNQLNSWIFLIVSFFAFMMKDISNPCRISFMQLGIFKVGPSSFDTQS